jgi:hypothetical protein
VSIFYTCSLGVKFGALSSFVLFIYWAGVEPSPLLLRPHIGLLHQPWLLADDGSEAVGAEGTGILGETLPDSRFVHHNSHMTLPGLEPGAAAIGDGISPTELTGLGHELNSTTCLSPEAGLLRSRNHHTGSYRARFEVFTAVTKKNVVFWDIETRFVLHR